MIANIRLVEGGESRALCQLDLMRFTENQVRERMLERGIDEQGFFICGFEDWGTDNIVSLSHAYRLKDYIQTVCGGNDYLVKQLLKKHWPMELIFEKKFEFAGNSELELLVSLFSNRSARNIAVLLMSAGSVKELITRFIQSGKIVTTAKGFYISSYRKELNG